MGRDLKEAGRLGARIRYSFFKKEVLTPTVFYAKAKIVTLAEEMRRRLWNMDEYHSDREIEEVTKEWILERPLWTGIAR